MGDDPGLSQWAQSDTKFSYKMEARGSQWRKRDMTMGPAFGVANFEDETRS